MIFDMSFFLSQNFKRGGALAPCIDAPPLVMVNKDVFGSIMCPLLGPYMVHFLFSLPALSSCNTVQHIFLQTRTNISAYLNTYIVLQHVSTFHTVYNHTACMHISLFKQLSASIYGYGFVKPDSSKHTLVIHC